jgi:hypothetical protein
VVDRVCPGDVVDRVCPGDVVDRVCPGDVVDRLPESITPRKRQNSIGEFLCTIHFWTI